MTTEQQQNPHDPHAPKPAKPWPRHLVDFIVRTGAAVTGHLVAWWIRGGWTE